VIDLIEGVGGSSTSSTSVATMFKELNRTMSGVKSEISKQMRDEMSDMSLGMYRQLEKQLDREESHESMINRDLRTVKNEMENMIVKLSREMNAEMKEYVAHSNLMHQMPEIERMIREMTVAMSRELKDYVDRSDRTISDIDHRLPQIETMVGAMTREMKEYLDRMKRPSARGAETETILKILLENALPTHEINHVASRDQKGRMDLNVIRDGYPMIMLESKDHARNVPKRDVEKFESDIRLSGEHGILVSHGGISNKEHFHVSKINNKYAIYLSNISTDVKDVVTAIKMLYYLDSISVEDADATVKIGINDMERINTMIAENVSRIKSIRHHLTLSLDQCDSLMFDGIQQTLGSISRKTREKSISVAPVKSEASENWVCRRCTESH
jgi:hypothetical protein